MQPVRRLVITSLLARALAGCGGDNEQEEGSKGTDDLAGVEFGVAIREAQAVQATDLPATRGRTLQQIAGQLPAIQLGLATSVYTPGSNRLAFGMLDQTNAFVYGKTGVYLARTPDGRALGRFPRRPIRSWWSPRFAAAALPTQGARSRRSTTHRSISRGQASGTCWPSPRARAGSSALPA